MDIRGAIPPAVAATKSAAAAQPPQQAAVPPATTPQAGTTTGATVPTGTPPAGPAAPAAAAQSSSPMGFLAMARAAQPTVATGPLNSTFGFGSDGLGFDDVIDAINPLQHIPVISTIYRAITGDHIDPMPRMIGDAIFGGPLGFALSAVDSAIEDSTGKDTEGHIMAALFGEPKSTPKEPVQFAANGSQTGAASAKSSQTASADSTVAAAVAGAAAQASAGPGAWYMASVYAPPADSTVGATTAPVAIAAVTPPDRSLAPAAGPGAIPVTSSAPVVPQPEDANALLAGNHPLTKAQLAVLGQGNPQPGGTPNGGAPAKAAAAASPVVASPAIASPAIASPAIATPKIASTTIGGTAINEPAITKPAAGPAIPQPASGASAGATGGAQSSVGASSVVDLTPSQLTLLLKSVGIDPSTVPQAAGGSAKDGASGGAPASMPADGSAQTSNTAPVVTPAAPSPIADATAPTTPAPTTPAPAKSQSQRAVGTVPPIPTAISRSVPYTDRAPSNVFAVGGLPTRPNDPTFAQKMQRGLDSYMKHRVALDPHPLTIDTTR